MLYMSLIGWGRMAPGQKGTGAFDFPPQVLNKNPPKVKRLPIYSDDVWMITSYTNCSFWGAKAHVSVTNLFTAVQLTLFNVRSTQII